MHHITEILLKVPLNIITPKQESVPVDLGISHFIFKDLDICLNTFFNPFVENEKLERRFKMSLFSRQYQIEQI